ncbi:FAD-dependent oxidoreductase [Bradyrhizobium manausense]|uniref:FAD-dependent oxidoreductase n=1 Tax=Bradyrhizobium manausense TaxID=989370 RepID=UPI001BA8BBD2|nr:FAD-dependent oxidoreductase [Bradyrhizobium manausense]MBR0724977.1 FAD-dependent oxidoreductase [Bradyrhizobium manausense]
MNPINIDVLVCGGGMAGTVAAIAAGRNGAETLLVERWGFLGGSATAAAVGQFVGWETEAGRRVIRGIAEEIVDNLRARGASDGHSHFVMSTGHRMDQVSYDPETLKIVLDELVTRAPAHLLFNTVVMSVARTERTINEVTVLTKKGPIALRPKVVIDASGDLDVLARASATFLSLEEGETLQPATMMFRFGPIDYEAFNAIPTPEIHALAQRGVHEGALARAALHQSRVTGTQDGWFNVSRVSVDATDPFDLSRAEVEGRRQAFAAANFIRENVPGCAGGRLVALAAQLGIRETRRVSGNYILTVDDLRRGRTFSDVIACGAYPIDIHPATGTGLGFETLGKDHSYQIPYRSIVPSGFDNVLIAGRGISSTHEAHASTRVMPNTMAIGHAAGLAAAMIAEGNIGARELPVERMQAKLREANAYLG